MAIETDLLETPLAALHAELGARMVPFAGYLMPLHYPAGILAEHLHCRAAAALFDVSHMGQAELPLDAIAALEALTPADLLGIKPGRQRYALLTTEAGGIFDDCVVAHLGDRLGLVVNASRKAADFARLAAAGVAVRPRPDLALLALQGPSAWAAVAAVAGGLPALSFQGVAECRIGGVPVVVARSGYTGEDGVELGVPASAAERVARALLAQPGVLPAGLGARDSLRLEAGLCLYGQDIDETANPIEAGLTWTLGKRRRIDWNFLGAGAIRAVLDHGPARRRVGLRPDGRQPARAGAPILDAAGARIGTVTSGGFGPSADAPVAMGYVATPHAADGTVVMLEVRGRALPARVAPLPFIPHRYAR